MSFPRLLLIFAVILFGAIGAVSLFKEKTPTPETTQIASATSISIPLEGEVRVVTAKPEIPPAKVAPVSNVVIAETQIPEINRISEFFNKGSPQFPIVETVIYHSRVAWQKGRPAWLSDYAAHYHTSRHFIARSLNGKPDYLKQDITEGDRFNILKPEKNVEFHLVVDLHRCKMLFYYVDLDTKERVHVKTYDVGLGRIDTSRASGFLTPLGKYTLGDRTATYKPSMKGFHNGDKVELIKVFGTRWIPFEAEVANCTEPAKGLGIHGVPWAYDEKSARWNEDTTGIGKHLSDGCIRIATADMEELFSIIISRPTTVELVRNFSDATLPGRELAQQNKT
ncbi:MAG: L,D-transpeptidase [Chlamydiales bacterium]|nr:L,D-transpeptidase [Chlamydiales bacterium]